MKKFISAFIIIMIGLVLVACKKPVEEDKTKPEITGAVDISINVGDTFDPLDGVTATDNVDGDLTDDIVVLGSVDTNIANDYTLRYKVTDAAGNVAQVYRKVTVVFVPTPSDDMVVNGDFTQGVNGWDTLNQDGGDADFTVENEELKIVINAVSWQQYSPRLSQSGITYEQGKTYEVKFDARALDNKKVHVQVGELLSAAPWFTNFDSNTIVYELDQTMTTYSFKFTMTNETNENGAVIFEFGTTVADGSNEAVTTTVFLDNVVIEEATPDPDTVKPVLSGVEDVTLEVGTPFDALEGVTVTDNQDINISVDDITVSGDTVDVNTPGEYTVTYTVSDASNNEEVVNRVVKVVEIVFTETDKIANGDFAAALDETDPEWISIANDGAAMTLSVVDGVLVSDLTATGANPWSAQIEYDGLEFVKGKTYKIVFDAKADVARNIKLVVGWTDVNNNYAWNSFLGENPVNEFSVTDVLDTYELIFTMEESTYSETSVKFEFGTGDANKLYFDNIKILELDESVSIDNPNFEDNGWSNFIDTNGWSSVAAGVTFTIDENGYMVADVTSNGGAAWAIQLIQNGLTFEKDQTYQVTFKAKADVDTYFEMPIGYGNWTEIARYDFSDKAISNEWQDFTYEFTYTGDTVENAVLKFELGKYVDDNDTPDNTDDDVVISAPGKVYFDDIHLLKKDESDQFVDTNQVTNPGFDLNPVNWNVGANDGAALTATVDQGVAIVDVTALGANSYSAELFQDGLTFKKGRTYTVEFDIKADDATSVLVALFETGSWTSLMGDNYEKYQVDITDTTDYTHVKFSFEMTKDTLSNGKFSIELGTINDESDQLLSTTTTYYIDNVIVYPNFN